FGSESNSSLEEAQFWVWSFAVKSTMKGAARHALSSRLRIPLQKFRSAASFEGLCTTRRFSSAAIVGFSEFRARRSARARTWRQTVITEFGACLYKYAAAPSFNEVR